MPLFTLRTFPFDDVVPEVKYITSLVTEPPVSVPPVSVPVDSTVTSAVFVVMVYESLAALVFAAVEVGVTVITQ